MVGVHVLVIELLVIFSVRNDRNENRLRVLLTNLRFSVSSVQSTRTTIYSGQ